MEFLLNTILTASVMSLFLASAVHVAFAYDDQLVILETNQGDIVLEFFPDDAPNHVANLVDLAQSGFYDGILFHRIIPGFMIQAGDPNTIDGEPATWGTGGPSTTVDAEFNTIKHNRGILSMARTADPNSAGSQFFIVHQDSNFLDQQYTVFGRVVTEQSLETLDKIASVETRQPGDAPADPEQVRIIKASVVARSDVPGLLELGPPERVSGPPTELTQIPPIPSDQNQLYEDPNLNVVFSAPPGWLLQRPEKLDQDTPDLIAIGPTTNMMNPVISLTISDIDAKSFEEVVLEKNQALEEAQSIVAFDIDSQEESTIHGYQALTTLASGTFETGTESISVKFKEIVFYTPEKLYAIYYSNGADDFDAKLPAFEESIESFEILGSEPPTIETPDVNLDSETTQGGGCLIATAAFGSELAPQVQLLREIRDNKVMGTASGAAFMTGFNQIYYSFSPGIADLQRESPVFKEAVKLAITPMLFSLSLLNYVEINSEYDMLGYGLAIMALNAGMYVAAPAVIISRILR